MKITGNSARNLNKAALNSSRATRRPMNSSRMIDEQRQLNCNHKATRRSAVNAAARRPVASVATERPMLNSSARRSLDNDDKNYKLNSACRPLEKLNSNRSAILEELDGWFDKDEAVEYLDSFENTTGATATKLATDEEVDKYDGVFWATKDGKESLWCLHNGMWVEQDLDSAKNLNSAEGDSEAKDDNKEEETATEEEAKEEPATEKEEAVTEEETTVTDADGNDIVVENLLIVQDPESKEISLFVPESEDDALPEGVEVIAEVEATTELDSSCHGKAKKLNSAEGEATEDAETEAKEDEAATEEEAEVELPDGEVVDVEDIYVVQDTETKELDIFIVEEDNDAVPEGVEVIGEATPADDETVLDSARKLKKFTEANKINSSKLNSAKDELEKKIYDYAYEKMQEYLFEEFHDEVYQFACDQEGYDPAWGDTSETGAYMGYDKDDERVCKDIAEITTKLVFTNKK